MGDDARAREQVEAWLADGTLLHPVWDGPGFLDLVHAAAGHAGIERPVARVDPARVAPWMPEAEHVVLVLADGMGTALLGHLPEDAFLREHHTATLRTVFLSTTVAAITALGTGLWPADQAAPGWWTYLAGPNITAAGLPMEERFFERELRHWGVRLDDLFPLAPLWTEPEAALTHVLPADIVDSVYTRRMSGHAERRAYADLADGLEQVYEAMTAAAGHSLTYLYLPHVDTVSHDHGTESAKVRMCLAALDQGLADLASALAGRAALVVTADHGLVTVPDEARCILREDDPLVRMLRAWPTGEATVPVFHVRDGLEERFAHAFHDRFGACFRLLTPASLEALQLFGPGALSPLLRERLGTFVGIAPAPALVHVEPLRNPYPPHRGVHGGLRPAEMEIPLIVAEG